MTENVEVGCFRDNEAVLRTARYNLERATDSKSIDAARSVLMSLRDHILRAPDPKSHAILLPEILALLEIPNDPTGAMTPKTVSTSGKIVDGSISSPSGEYQAPGSRKEWLQTLSDSILPQVLFLCMHFLLVLSVLSFNLVISDFLSRFHVDIKSYVEPILRTTDVCLVGVFCAESLILLVITAVKEILDKGHSLRPNVKGRSDPGGAYPAADDRALNTFCQVNEEQIKFLEKEKACGRFTKDAVEMPHAFAVLGQTHSSFDAISRDELPFWLADPTDPFAEEYFLSGMDLVRKGKRVTRIFLLSRNQIEQSGVLKQVLLKHLRAGIGFSVVPFDPLPAYLRKRAKELDFGLWDHGSAYSVFRQREGGYARKMGIVFSCAGSNSDVATKLDLYKEILAHAWLVDKAYMDNQKDMISELRPRIKDNNNHLLRQISAQMDPEGIFYINVGSESELNEKVNKLLILWGLTRNGEQTQPIPQEIEGTEEAQDRT